MNSKVMMTANNQKLEARNIVDKIRVRVPPKLSKTPSSSSSSSSNHRKQLNSVHDCSYSYTNFLIENHSNFKRSGAPGRVMYYEEGAWVDFSNQVMDSVKSGFLEGKPMVEIEIGDSKCLFDFYRMLQIDFETGNSRSVAWIDVDGHCFFPKTFVSENPKIADVSGNPKIEISDVSEKPNIEVVDVSENLSSEYPKIEIEIRIAENFNSNKRKRETEEEEENTEGSSSNDRRLGLKKKQLGPSDFRLSRWPKAKLLKEGETAYSVVKNVFLSWLGVVEPGAVITGIHQCMRIDPLDRARYEVFQKQMAVTKAARGAANMTFAWHGTSAKGVASILSHGFGLPSKISGHQSHGVGIYLSHVLSSHLSAKLWEVDGNGEKHVILCRVILGKCEKVEPGSQQLYPSSVDFDTGVDDVNNPTWYVVWCANMNTHILPECVVSFKSSCHVPGQLNGSSFPKGVPNALNVSTKLFSKLGNSLPSSKARELQTLCSTYKDGKVAKETFMKQLRSIVGDDMLLSTIREIRG